jgi:hypothetical protein
MTFDTVQLLQSAMCVTEARLAETAETAVISPEFRKRRNQY